MPFQAKKTRSSKSRKTDIFVKWLNPAFCRKMSIFPSFFFRRRRPGKCLLRYSRTKKMPFQGIKTRSSKSRKIDIFPKGLTHGFGPKMAIFPTFIFQEIQARKISFTIFQNEKTSFYATKTRSQKSRKIDIFPKGLAHGFGPKMAIFPTLFFQAIQSRKMSFTIFQNKKKPFQGIKTRSSKSRKIDIFSKGANPWFWSKNGCFSNSFFLGNIGQKNVFHDILERKNCLSRL